jgi:hypothetical protein
LAVFEKLSWKEIALKAAPQAAAFAGRRALERKSYVPVFPPELPVRERAILLLRAASEVEHQFVIQYLYALYCGGGDHASDLVTIAKEEMGHLITVQNLLATLGAAPYLGRIGGAEGVKEALAFTLEPFQISFIARFLVAESAESADLPADIEPRLPPGLDLDEIYRVGALYQAIYWLFQNPTAATGPWNVPLGSDVSDFQTLGHLADSDFANPQAARRVMSLAMDWGGTAELTSTKSILVMPAATWGADVSAMRSEALTAIHAVAAQGEGPVVVPGGTKPSHAERLRGIYDALAAAPPPAPTPYPTNPFVKEGSADPNALSGEATAVAKELDEAYERLLLTIALAVVTMPDEGGDHAMAARGIMSELRGAAKDVASKPRRTGEPALLAGPPFTFPAQGIPSTKQEIQDRLDALA